MSPAALYIHYKTKEELLHRISRIGHDRALLLLETAADRDGTASERLADAVRSFVSWHAERHTTARVVQYELEALGEEHRAEIVALRRRSDAAVRRIIGDGVRGRRVRRTGRPGHHARRAVPLHRRGALVQRPGQPDARGGRHPLRGPRPAHGGRHPEAVTPGAAPKW